MAFFNKNKQSNMDDEPISTEVILESLANEKVSINPEYLKAQAKKDIENYLLAFYSGNENSLPKNNMTNEFYKKSFETLVREKNNGIKKTLYNYKTKDIKPTKLDDSLIYLVSSIEFQIHFIIKYSIIHSTFTKAEELEVKARYIFKNGTSVKNKANWLLDGEVSQTIVSAKTFNIDELNQNNNIPNNRPQNNYGYYPNGYPQPTPPQNQYGLQTQYGQYGNYYSPNPYQNSPNNVQRQVYGGNNYPNYQQYQNPYNNTQQNYYSNGYSQQNQQINQNGQYPAQQQFQYNNQTQYANYYGTQNQQINQNGQFTPPQIPQNQIAQQQNSSNNQYQYQNNNLNNCNYGYNYNQNQQQGTYPSSLQQNQQQGMYGSNLQQNKQTQYNPMCYSNYMNQQSLNQYNGNQPMQYGQELVDFENPMGNMNDIPSQENIPNDEQEIPDTLDNTQIENNNLINQEQTNTLGYNDFENENNEVSFEENNNTFIENHEEDIIDKNKRQLKKNRRKSDEELLEEDDFD